MTLDSIVSRGWKDVTFSVRTALKSMVNMIRKIRVIISNRCDSGYPAVKAMRSESP